MLTGRTRLARRLTCAVAALALFATACGGSSGDVTVESSAPATNAASATPQAQPEQEPEPAQATLVASTVAGGQIDFGDLQGQDVVLWFWAPW